MYRGTIRVLQGGLPCEFYGGAIDKLSGYSDVLPLPGKYWSSFRSAEVSWCQA